MTTALVLNYRRRRTSEGPQKLAVVPIDEMRAAAATYPYGLGGKCYDKCGGYTCTRSVGHEGRHAAHLTMQHTADSVGATWE